MKTTHTKNPAAVALGRLGGRAGKGKAKARSSEQARAAGLKGAAKRWHIKIATVGCRLCGWRGSYPMDANKPSELMDRVRLAHGKARMGTCKGDIDI